MALTDDGSNGMVMPVTPMGGYGGGFGGYGGDFSSWIILLLIFGMFGNGGWGNFGGGFDFPWLLNGQNGINSNVNAGFDNLGLQNQLTGIQNSLNSAEVANCNRAMDAMQTAYNNQIAAMNQNFANQQALDARLYGMQSEQQNCCCENRLATAQTQALVQSEGAATRAAGTANTQAILDKLCQQELDAERRENAELRSRINMLDLAASQAQQTAQLVSDNAAQTQYIVNRVAPYPIPAYPVSNPYGYNGYYGGFGFNPFGNVGFGNGSF